MYSGKEIKIIALDEMYKDVLRDAFLEAIYNPGNTPLPREVLHEKDLVKYHESWGGKDDFGFVAIYQDANVVVGACWCRLFTADSRGFGYVDDETPELAIAVWESCRNQGIGTRLLDRTIREAKSRGYRGISLSVQKENRSASLYRRNGFEMVSHEDDAYTLYLHLA
jgi:ribosomal protein S18 acetylase RimI-like enzyme